MLTLQDKKDLIVFAVCYGRPGFPNADGAEIDRLAALMNVSRPSGSNDDRFGPDLAKVILADWGTATGRFAV